MKKIILLLSLVLFAAHVAAQNPTAYFMEGSTFRSQFNPAFAPLRGYVNIPGLGNLNVNTNGNLSLDKILFPRNGKLVTLLDRSVSPADALSGLSANNVLGLDTRVNLIGFGAFGCNHRDFWSFELNTRVDADASLPYSLFEFLKLGSNTNSSNIGVTANAYLEAAFSYSFPLVNNKLYIGVRGKFLMGAARARLNYDRFDATLDENRWLVNAQGSLDITADGTRPKTPAGASYKLNDLEFKPRKPAGYGFAVDLGATYDILPNLQASLAVNDLGFISWSPQHTISGVSVQELEFKGVEVSSEGVVKQPDFKLNMLEFTPAPASGTTRMLQAVINAGLEYELWRHKIGLGVLYNARFRYSETLHNITASVNFHPIRWFTVTGSYSVVVNRGGVMGLALNLNPNWINFYIATDIVTARHTPQFLPINQSVMNITLGLGIPIGRRSHRIPEYIYGKDFQ